MPYDREDIGDQKTVETSLNAPIPSTSSAAVSVRGVKKRFGRFPALNDVSLEIRPGELLALLGPSGSGKTTLLRTIAGLEFPDEGQVLFDEQDVTFAAAAERGVGFVFQQYALFRHMTVARNVAFGLDVRTRKTRPKKADIADRVNGLLKLVELDGLGKRYPMQLSGGQRQRVALARALAVSPQVLLLDEPFGALDATVRKSLRRELRRIHDTAGVATVFVTHDQEEALELADRVAVLNNGRIEQIGTPHALQNHPSSAFVAGFVGGANRLEGEVKGGQFCSGDLTIAAAPVADGPAVAFIRPDQFQPSDKGVEITIDRIAGSALVLEIGGTDVAGHRLDIALARTDAASIPERGAKFRVEAMGGHVFAAS